MADYEGERIWDEYQWERFLQQQDQKTEKYMELLEKYLDDPQRDQIIAREMGWNHLLNKEGQDWADHVDSQFSARGVLTASHTDAQSLSSADVFVYDVPRGIHYGLNFYLRGDLPEWTSETRGFVFSSSNGQSRLQAQGYVCQQHAVFPAAVLCKAPEDLAAHASGSGKAQ